MKIPLFLVVVLAVVGIFVAATCPTVVVKPDFDLDMYIHKPWYVHQQAVVSYLPREDFFCVRAHYSKVGGWFHRTLWGYTVRVNNEAQDESGQEKGGGLCAYQTDKESDPAKLAVAPCFLPKLFSGAYWVVAYEEGEHGYAIVSGGQPTIEVGNNTCRTDNRGYTGGLWIFGRSQTRNETTINKARSIASGMGFDLSVLFNVTQEGCTYDGGRRLANLRS